MKYYIVSKDELLQLVNSVWNATVVAECDAEITKLIAELDRLQSRVYYTIDGMEGQGYSPCDDIRFKDALSDAYPKLRALIEAGQAMRAGLGRNGSAVDTLDDIYIANDIGLALAVEAWDEATKEGV